MSSLVKDARDQHRTSAPFWLAMQMGGLAATVALLVGLGAWPKPTLTVLWNVVVPILPATFLIAPALWRNVCPLATANTLLNGRVSRRPLPESLRKAAGLAGILLLLVLVPARRFLFNGNGAVLAIVIVVVAVAALALGSVFDVKAGFCNAICPVLPVERLYGQRPLADVGNPRCGECTQCSPRGCIDLAPTKSIAQTLGPSRRSNAWLRTPYGAFAAAFPGFVIGYYTLADGPLTTALPVYLHVAAWMAGSWIAVALGVTVVRVHADRMIALIGAAALALYYWFAAPVIAAAIHAGDAGALIIRILAAALIAFWLAKAFVLPASNGIGMDLERP